MRVGVIQRETDMSVQEVWELELSCVHFSDSFCWDTECG
jgi:hypothetical protein